MKKTFSRRLQDIWYKDPFIGAWLMPLGFVFSDIVRFRRFCYRIGVKKTVKLKVPVIMVGNLTVGGTGKTPLVIYLAKRLKASGYRPGIIARGYGGKAQTWPLSVTQACNPDVVGDEPLLLAKHSGCPVAVGPKRVESAQLLLDQNACDLIISDDGLQHYALARDIEIVVVDGERWFGNGYCLPAGPLREPSSRLESVDFVVVNGEKNQADQFSMQFTGNVAVNLQTGENRPLAEFIGQPCHAVAGIGNPERFFKLLENAGLTPTCHSFPDHYRFAAADLQFKNNLPVLMTEKDAVKCGGFDKANLWQVPVQAELEPEFDNRFLELLREKTNG